MLGLRDYRSFAPDRQYLLSRLLRAVSLLLTFFLVFYLFYHIGDGFQTKLETDFAVPAQCAKELTMEGYIFRDESTISVAGGTVRYHFDNYEKVEAHGMIATVYSSTSLDTRLNVSLLDALDRRIALLTEAAARAQLLADSEATDREIGNALALLNDESKKGQYGAALGAADSLLLQMARKELQQSSKTSYATEIAALTKMRNELDKELSETGIATEVLAGESGGYFTRTFDGYEEIFDYSRVMDMSISEFDSMTKKLPSAQKTDKIIGKTIETYKWYIVARTDRQNLDNFRTGNQYAVNFPDNDNREMSMLLERTVLESGSKDALLIFSCNNLPADFSYTRHQNISVTYGTVSGLQVSRSAIRVIDGHPFVYTLFGAQIKLKAVDIIDRVGGYYYIKPESASYKVEKGKHQGFYEGLRQNDCVITYGIDLVHGRMFK